MDSPESSPFSMNAAEMTSGLVRTIHRRGAGVHVWTVNDDRMALRVIEMGVDNLITGLPERKRYLVDDWALLEDPEKIALQLRRLILPDEELSVSDL